tara:strand:- start:167 stop:589 length:423 start_codon:yes stop_codon:yes gene_type:complete
MDEKSQEALGSAIERAVQEIVIVAAEFDMDPVHVTQASLLVPFSILLGLCRAGEEFKMAELGTAVIVEAAQAIGKDIKRAAALANESKRIELLKSKKEKINAAKVSNSKLYDGPLKEEDVPEEIRKNINEFFGNTETEKD